MFLSISSRELNVSFFVMWLSKSHSAMSLLQNTTLLLFTCTSCLSQCGQNSWIHWCVHCPLPQLATPQLYCPCCIFGNFNVMFLYLSKGGVWPPATGLVLGIIPLNVFIVYR